MNEALGIQRYQETEVASICPEKLLVLLYEALLRHLRQTKELIIAADQVAANRHLDSAQAIVSELRGALDHQIGGDIADNLAAIYDYVFQENLNLLLDRDVSHIDHCVQVLLPLYHAWQQIPPGTAAQHIRETAQHRGETADANDLEGIDPAAKAGPEPSPSSDTSLPSSIRSDSPPDPASNSQTRTHSICLSA